MSDPKNVADSNKVKFRAVQRWAGAGMTTKMTMTIELKHGVNKCLMELLEAAQRFCFVLLRPFLSLVRVKHCETWAFLVVGSRTCTRGVVPDFPGAWKPG